MKSKKELKQNQIVDKDYESKMIKRVAIVHDAIIEYGGGEKVLNTLIKLFPKADIYTSVLKPNLLEKALEKKIIQNKFNHLLKKIQSRQIIQFINPFYWPFLNLERYDLIISHGGFYLSQMVHLTQHSKRDCHHVHYCITPPKNLYFPECRRSSDKILNIAYYPILRLLDKRSISRVHTILSVSKAVSKRIKKIYKRKSAVIHPPVYIHPNPPPTTNHYKKRKWYIYTGRLSQEKRIGLIITTFNKNKKPLLVVGKGPEEKKLKKISEKNITFTGFKNKRELRSLYVKSKAFVHAAIHDDFPIAPIEAMSYGTPVIAYHSGGLKEMIIKGKTGLFFHKHSIKSLNQAIENFEKLEFTPSNCYQHAKQFSENNFKRNFQRAIKASYETQQQFKT